MIDVWSVVRWWDDWQLRVLVLGSLGFQWFLLVAAPMRKYTMPQLFRRCIWLAYISSDALAIYALATLFNRHARTVPASNCAPSKEHQSRILEVLWAPILLIHLGGQEELTGYEIEDNELWTRHTVTLVTQVAVAIYAFYKSWPSSVDWKLTAAAILLFVIGVLSFSEKPLALNRAKIKRLAAVSAWIQGTKKPSSWRESMSRFFLFDESNCFTATGLPHLSTTSGKKGGENRKGPVALSEADKVLMVLSDMSLLAAAKDLVDRKRATDVAEVLPPLTLAERVLPRWLRRAFAFIYTRATVVVTPVYLVYHLLVVPALHIAALTLFATSDKQEYKRADVKITYIILCLTAALDFLAVFIRQLVYGLMSMTEIPALCETVPGYNIIDEAIREADKSTGWMYICARQLGLRFKGEYFGCRPRPHELYKKVVGTLLPDLVLTQDKDLDSYRIFHSIPENWALNKELQDKCGAQVKESLEDVSFDRSVLLWHIATDLCFRSTDVISEGDEEEAAASGGGEGEGEGEGEIEEAAASEEDGSRRALRLHMECTEAISNYMAHLLNFNPEMLLTGSRHHLITEARDEVKSCFLSEMVKDSAACNCYSCCTGGIGCSSSCGCSCNCKCSELNHARLKLSQGDQLKKLIFDTADDKVNKPREVFHIIEACKLAKELLDMPDDKTRWKLMYQVWLGMLCYSASMCRGYLHAKSLGEGGEFLSYVWLVLSLKGAKSLADKLQMAPPRVPQPSHNN
ncbi:hypothetical protein EJB05_02569, partial [Eragrostis curvula]